MLRCQIVYNRSTLADAPDRLFAAGEPLGRLLVFTAKELRDAFEQTLEAQGASLGVWAVLAALTDGAVVSQVALATHAHLEGATITHHVDRLEALGLVTRELDPADRRVRRVHLTPAGAALRTRLVEAVAAFEQEVMAGLGREERERLRASLDRIRANLAARPGDQTG